MSQYQFRHPYNGGYAVPAYVEAEPQGRGTFTTKYTPRGTIGTVPKNRQVYNRTKWAAPDYTQGRYDKSAQTTKMLPRRTVGLLAPDFFARPTARFPVSSLEPNVGTVSTSLIGSRPASLGTLGGSSLGDLAPQNRAVPDPIVDYGKKGAKIILGEVMRLPRAERASGMQSVLEAIGPGFRADVDEKTKKYRAAGRPAKDALSRAVAASLSNKMLADFVAAGSGTTGNVFSDLGWFGSGIVNAVGDKLGALHCTVASSGITQGVATVAGGVYGGPAGAAAANAGAKVLAAPCGGGSKAPPPPAFVAPPPSPPSPLIPIAIVAGGALVLFMVLK